MGKPVGRLIIWRKSERPAGGRRKSGGGALLCARALAVLCLLTLLPAALASESAGFSYRLPAPAVWSAEEKAAVLSRGKPGRTGVLEAALTLLEEGNPFLERYNLLNGTALKPRLPFGVPYLYGGRAASHVFAKAPGEYVVQKAWIDSPIWYRRDTFYLYGFDCVGLVQWAWETDRKTKFPPLDALLADVSRHVYDSQRFPLPDWEETARHLAPGDLFVRRGEGNHTGFYLGTLCDFGYTAQEIPELAPYLHYPLVLHTTNNASIAARFQWLIDHGIPKYRLAAVTDGGVMVSLLGPDPSEAPGHVVAQKQDTWYFTLPDGTWLTVMPWENVRQYCFFRYADESFNQ